MLTRSFIIATLFTLTGAALAVEAPKLGQPASTDEIAAYDIDVMPDGRFLPPGFGTAKLGAPIYAEKCQSCHGDKGQGATALPLAGGVGSIGKGPDVKPLRTAGSYWPYATSIFAYMRRAMPYYETKSLTNDELYALTAWVLATNKIIRDDEVMNAQTLARVQMPWRDHFRPFRRGD